MLGLIRARMSGRATSGAQPTQKLNETALKLPLEIIEYILHLAVPSVSHDPASVDLRTACLLRIGLTCRFLHEWAEERLLKEIIFVEGVRGLRRLANWIKRRPERAPRIRQLGLLLEETEEMAMRKPQQQKALNALFALCTELRVLRLQGPQWRTFVGVEPFAELQHLQILHLINIVIEPRSRTRSLHFAWPPIRTQEAPAPLLAVTSLRLSNSVFSPAQSLPHLSHLVIDQSIILPFFSVIRVASNLRFLNLGEGGTDGGPQDYAELPQRTSLLSLGVPFARISHPSLTQIPASVRHLRFHSTRLLRLHHFNAGFAILAQALDGQWECFRSLERITMGAGGLHLLVLSEVREMWERFQEAAERRGGGRSSARRSGDSPCRKKWLRRNWERRGFGRRDGRSRAMRRRNLGRRKARGCAEGSARRCQGPRQLIQRADV